MHGVDTPQVLLHAGRCKNHPEHHIDKHSTSFHITTYCTHLAFFKYKIMDCQIQALCLPLWVMPTAFPISTWDLPCLLTTSRVLTCIHTKPFPTVVKRRTCIHDLRRYSRNLYRYAIFSESSVSHLGDPWQKALQTMIEPTLLVDFLPHPFIQHLFLCPTSQERE